MLQASCDSLLTACVKTGSLTVAALQRNEPTEPRASSTPGGRALENIDSKNTGRVAREQAVVSDFRHRLLKLAMN
jgi:hypothetical protein